MTYRNEEKPVKKKQYIENSSLAKSPKYLDTLPALW